MTLPEANNTAWSDSEQPMVSVMIPKRHYSLDEEIPIYCAMYYPPTTTSISLEIFDGKKWLQKTGFGLNVGWVLLPSGKVPKRNLHIARSFTLSARSLGIGRHWITVKIRETEVTSVSDSIIIDIHK